MKDTLERAKSLYKRHHYRLALEILDSHARAIPQLSISDQIQALDLLAALLEKQGSLSRAQSCAVQIIRADPHEIRGYLRLGKIIQLSENSPKQAIKVYERALVKAKFKTSQQKEFVNRQLMLAKQRISPVTSSPPVTSRMDPLKALPLEIMILVVSNFEFCELLKLRQVSRRWNSFIESQSRFWSTIRIFPTNASLGSVKDFPIVECKSLMSSISRCRGPIRLDMQRALVKSPNQLIQSLGSNRVNERVEALIFNDTVPIKDPPLLSHLISLRESFDNLHQLRMQSNSPNQDLCWCVTQLPKLEELYLVTTNHVRILHTSDVLGTVKSVNLHTLSILGRTGAACIPQSTIEDIIRQLPLLKSVDLHSVISNFWPSLKPLIESTILERFGFSGDPGCRKTAPLPPFQSRLLKSITMNDITLYDAWSVRVPFSHCVPLHSLEYLELKRTNFIDSSVGSMITQMDCASSLEILVLHRMSCASDWYYKELPRLHTLQYTNMPAVDRVMAEHIGLFCKHLRKLNFDSTQVEGPVISSLLAELPDVVAIRCNNLVNASATLIKALQLSKKYQVFF